MDRLLPFIKIGKQTAKPLYDGSPASSAGPFKKDGEEKTGNLLKVVLIFIAIFFLVAGFIWKEGLIHPGIFLGLKPIDENTTEKTAPVTIPEESKSGNEKQKDTSDLENRAIKTDTIEEDKSLAAKEEVSPPASITNVEEGVPKEKKPLSPYAEGSYPFSIYMGSFQTLERAERAVSIFQEKGLSPFWVKVSLDEKGDWYRVYLGNFRNSDEAEKFGQEHNLAEMKVKKTAYANLIGTYISKAELENELDRIKKLGFSPYYFIDSTGLFRLLVGAFLTEQGVSMQSRVLKSDGIDNQIILR